MRRTKKRDNKKRIPLSVIQAILLLLVLTPIYLASQQLTALSQQQDSNLDAASSALKSPEKCQEKGCWKDGSFFWNTDRVGPRVQQGRVLTLDAIPPYHRLPPQAYGNVSAYSHYHMRRNPLHYPLLFEYNPSIVRWPTEHSTFVASFRVSSQHYCFRPEDRKRLSVVSSQTKLSNGTRVPMPHNVLGLALLDNNLDMVAQTVVRVPGTAEDFRLFVLHQQLYLSTVDQIAPIWLQETPPLGTNATRLAPVWDASLTLPVWIRKFWSCAPCEKKRGFCGKNFNYFAAGQDWVEVWPSPPHQVRNVDLTTRCRRANEPQQTLTADDAPKPSFMTDQQLRFDLPLSRSRGGACCMELPIGNRTLLVGISHAKTIQSRKENTFAVNHYVSQFYAVSDTAPFPVVARSGHFCFGFPSPTEENEQPIVQLTTWRKLFLGETLECPRIHFVTGMTRYDNDTALVSYGINDCISRFVRIPIVDIVEMLLGPTPP